MANDSDSDEPTSNSEQHPPLQSEIHPATPEQSKVGTDAEKGPKEQPTVAQEMRREFRWFEFGSLFINGALVVVGIYALCIYSGQLTVMRGQLGEIIKQYPELQKSANAARDGVSQSQKSLDATIEQFHLDQRAWLVPEFTKTNIEPASMAEQIVNIMGYAYQQAKIDNRGKTPATHFHAEFMAVLAKPGDTPRFTYPSWKYSADAPLMFPNNPFPFEFPLTRDSGDHVHAERLPIDRATLDALHNGNILLLVYGTITYRDVFGGDHFIHICAPQRGMQHGGMIFSVPASKACVQYNQIDQQR